MIVYTLRCANSHEFEDWFSSSRAFDEQSAAGEVSCPVCHSRKIEKAPMAPSVSKSTASTACPVTQSTGQVPPCAGSCACFPE